MACPRRRPSTAECRRQPRARYENYYVVTQNIRGRFKSEGKFVMGRPPHDPADPKGVDETTDAWDTVDWLIKNIPNNNGRAGIAGTSYDGWTAVMAALDPHPALKAAIEQASPADQFLGDDFHHNGAFRLSYGFEYSAMLETSSTENYRFQFDRGDTYDWYLGLGPLSNADERYFHGKLPTWEDFTHHPNYDAVLAAPGLRSVSERGEEFPSCTWPAGGTRRISTARRRSTRSSSRTTPRIATTSWPGPWNHGAVERERQPPGRHRFRLGHLRSITARTSSSRGSITGCAGRPSCTWPRPPRSRRAPTSGGSTTRGRPSKGSRRGGCISAKGAACPSMLPPRDGGFDEYVSDPANPVPYRPRPVPPTYPGPEWRVWLVQDQRFVDHRPDVLSWQTEPLAADVRVAGDIAAELFASTSGTDSDWVVKLIDVYPEDAPDDAETKTKMARLSTHHRGRDSAGAVSQRLRAARGRAGGRGAALCHRPAHQCARLPARGIASWCRCRARWFPVYDRNPQKFVPNIFEAHAEDYVKATQRIYRAPQRRARSCCRW